MLANIFKSWACLLIILIKEGQPLDCYMCTSVSDPSCGEPFNPVDPDTGTKLFYTNCEELFHLSNRTEHIELLERMFGPNAKSYCKKVVFTMFGSTIVQRGCSYGVGESPCEPNPGDGECEGSVCYEDGCNAAAPYDRVALLLTPVLLLHRIL